MNFSKSGGKSKRPTRKNFSQDPISNGKFQRLQSFRFDPIIPVENTLGEYFMMRTFLFATMIFGIISLTNAEDKPFFPKGNPPFIALAQASEKGGTITIRISIPAELPDGTETIPDPTKKTTGVIVPKTKIGWADSEVKLDGKKVRALTTSNKAIDAKTLSKQLAKPSRIAVFYNDTDPDPYYLGLFRDDVIVIVIGPEKETPPTKKGR
jgi:hypothetical protein